MTIVSAAVVVSVMGLIGAVILALASSLMHVEEDVRVESINEVLPAVNCGACGFAGCSDYATGVVDGAAVNLCVPGGDEVAKKIAEIMGSGDSGEVKKMRAIMACQGTAEHRGTKYEYSGGVETCSANAALFGGRFTCPYGCLGFGDCIKACRFGAIKIENGLAKIDMEKCTGCGACVEACPKRVIWIREKSSKAVVMCANHEKGAVTRKQCDIGCIACMKCEKSCPEGAIHVVNYVARVDLDKCTACGICEKECPVGCIILPD